MKHTSIPALLWGIFCFGPFVAVAQQAGTEGIGPAGFAEAPVRPTLATSAIWTGKLGCLTGEQMRVLATTDAAGDPANYTEFV